MMQLSVRGFSDSGIEYRDAQDDDSIADEVRNRYKENIEFFQKRMPHKEPHPQGVCEDDVEERKERERRWRAYLGRNPGKNYGDFIKHPEAKIRDYQWDRDLPSVSYAAFVLGDLVGAVHVSNIQKRGRFLSANIMSGLPRIAPRSLLEVWSDTVIYFLSNPIRVIGAPNLRITEYAVPNGPGTRYREDLHPGIDVFFQRLERGGMTVVRRPSGTPIAVRSISSVPRQPRSRR